MRSIWTTNQIWEHWWVKSVTLGSIHSDYQNFFTFLFQLYLNLVFVFFFLIKTTLEYTTDLRCVLSVPFTEVWKHWANYRTFWPIFTTLVLLSIYFVCSLVLIYQTFTRFIGQCPAWLAVSTPLSIHLHVKPTLFMIKIFLHLCRWWKCLFLPMRKLNL